MWRKKKKTQNETKRNEKIHLRKKAKRIEKISVLLLFASNKKKKGKWNIVLTSGNVLIFPSQNGWEGGELVSYLSAIRQQQLLCDKNHIHGSHFLRLVREWGDGGGGVGFEEIVWSLKWPLGSFKKNSLTMVGLHPSQNEYLTRKIFYFYTGSHIPLVRRFTKIICRCMRNFNFRIYTRKFSMTWYQVVLNHRSQWSCCHPGCQALCVTSASPRNRRFTPLGFYWIPTYCLVSVYRQVRAVDQFNHWLNSIWHQCIPRVDFCVF